MMMASDILASRSAVKIVTADLDAQSAGDETCLTADERARANRFVFDKDRRRFIRGRAFLRRQLAQALNEHPGRITLQVAERGKPFVPGCPLRFNLSHSGPLAVLAISETADVGIDVELTASEVARDLDLLARRVLTGNEQKALQSLPDADRPGGFLTFWTAKESCMKLTGEGLARDPATIALALDGATPTGFLTPEDADISLSLIALDGWQARCALASRTT